MNDAMSKELQQPRVEPLLDTNRHRSAVEETLDSRSKGLVPERITRTLRMLRQNAAATVLAGLFALGNANCNNVEQQNTPPPIPPPAVSEYQKPTPPAELVPTTEVPSPPPTIEQAPTLTPTPPETPTPAVSKAEGIPITEIGLTDEVKRIRDEKRAVYSRLMDEIETGVSKDKLYFVTVGEKDKYQDRTFIFTEPVEQDGEKVWIALTRDGPKTFSLKNSFFPLDQHNLPSDYIETFIKEGVEELKQGKNDFIPYERAILSEKWEETGSEIHSLIIREPDGWKNIFDFRPDPPKLEMIEEAMVKSQEAAGLGTPPEQLAREKLVREKLVMANNVYDALKPHTNPVSQQPPPPK